MPYYIKFINDVEREKYKNIVAIAEFLYFRVEEAPVKYNEYEQWVISYNNALSDIFEWICENHPEILTETEEAKNLLIRLIACYEKILEYSLKSPVHSKLRSLLN